METRRTQAGLTRGMSGPGSRRARWGQSRRMAGLRGAAGAGGSLARAALGSVGVRRRSERVAAGRTSRHLKRD